MTVFLCVGGCHQAPDHRPVEPARKEQNPKPLMAAEVKNIFKPAPMALDDLIVFKDGRNCITVPITSRLLDSLLVVMPDNSMRLGEVIAPGKFRTSLGQPVLDIREHSFYEATLPVSGTWHGLKLVNVAKSGTPQGDYGFWSYRFDEPFEKVRDVLNQMGFTLDEKGQQPAKGNEDYSPASLFRVQGLTALDCQ
jgi:hypothetical protein